MKPDKMNGWEIWLAVYASGFALDKFASVLGEAASPPSWSVVCVR